MRLNSAPMNSLCPEKPGDVGASSCLQNIEGNSSYQARSLAASQTALKTFSFKELTLRASDPNMKSEPVFWYSVARQAQAFVTSDQNV